MISTIFIHRKNYRLADEPPAYYPWPVWITNFRQAGFFDRKVKIQKMRDSGMTLKAIGGEFDITPARVRQILLKNRNVAGIDLNS
jgi:hypothetical protein